MVGYSVGIFRCINFIAKPLCFSFSVFFKDFENQWAKKLSCDTLPWESPENGIGSSLVTYVFTIIL